MAIQKYWGYDTPASPTSRSVSPQDLVFAENFRRLNPKSTKNEVVLHNVQSPIDRVESIRFGWEPIANIYNGSGIDPSLWTSGLPGVSVVAQVRESLRIQDTTLQTQIVVPFSAHLVVKAPVYNHVTTSDVEAVVTRLLGLLYEDSDSSMTARLASLLRGSVTPRGVL